MQPIPAKIGKALGRKLFGKKKTRRDRFHLLKKKRLEMDAKKKKQEKLSKKEEKKLQKLQAAEARYYAKLLPNSLAQQTLYSVSTQNGTDGKKKRRVLKKVRIIQPVLIHRDYYMIQIDTKHLPVGVNIKKLKDPDLHETLSFAMETEVKVDHSDVRGFWFLVARRGGLGIIPDKINYDDCVAMMPKRASAWAIPMGVGANRKLTWIDLRDRPHILIAGTSGSGKSVFLKSMLLTLAHNNSPKRFRFIICDFKNAADFVRFPKLPHIGTTSRIRSKNVSTDELSDDGEIITVKEEDFADYVITEPDDLLPVLAWANVEINRRNKRFGDINDDSITNINEYNRRHPRQPMPHIFLVIDEYPVAILEVPKKQAETIKKHVGIISRKGRSAGVHLVLGSQVGSADIMGGAISQNITTRLVGFSQGTQSQTIMGSWFASRISSNKGRMAFKDDLTERELQTPWVDPKHASKLIEAIAEKWDDGHDEDDTALKLFTMCLDKYDGLYEQDEIYRYFPDDADISRATCRAMGDAYELKNADGELGPEISIDGTLYYLVPAIPGKRARKLVTIEKYKEIMSQQEAQEEHPPQPPEPASPQYSWTEAQVMLWVKDNNNGDYSNRAVYDRFRDAGMTQKQSEVIGKKYESKAITIDSVDYILLPAKGRTPRKLVTCDLRLDRQTPNGNDSTGHPPTESKEVKNDSEANSSAQSDFSFLDDSFTGESVGIDGGRVNDCQPERVV